MGEECANEMDHRIRGLDIVGAKQYWRIAHEHSEGKNEEKNKFYSIL